MYTHDRHRKCQVVVTIAIFVAMVAHYALEYFAPEYKFFAPLAGACASVIWVWIE